MLMVTRRTLFRAQVKARSKHAVRNTQTWRPVPGAICRMCAPGLATLGVPDLRIVLRRDVWCLPLLQLVEGTRSPVKPVRDLYEECVCRMKSE